MNWNNPWDRPPITPPPSGGMPIYRETLLDKFLWGMVWVLFGCAILSAIGLVAYIIISLKYLPAP